MTSVIAPLALLLVTILGAPNVTVLAPAGSVNEGAVAVSPVNPRICVAAGIHFRTSGLTVETFHTADAGATWIANGAVPVVGAFTRQWDPVLVFDRSGAAYLTTVGATADDHLWTILVYRSTDGGATWSGVDAAKNTAGRTDKPWLAIDTSGGAFDGSLYATWFTFGNAGHNGMHLARSRDHGATWSEASTIASSGWPFIATGTDGSVYASYYDAGTNHIAASRSDDGGVTFGAPFTIAPERTFPAGTIAYGTSAHQMAAGGGNLYVAYPCDSDDAGHPPSSVCFTRSLDRGASWSTPLRLSLPTQESGLPSIAVDKTNSEVLLSWIGRDASSDSGVLWTTRSRDAGATFEDPHPVSDNFPAHFPAGDYNQSASFAALRLAMFSDTDGHLSVARLSWAGDPPLPDPPAQLPRRRSVRP